VISGGLGFAIADFADRFLATYDPAATGPAPTDRFTGGNGTMANTLNIAAPPSGVRLIVGIAIPAAFGLGAYMVKNSLGRAALQGACLGAAIKLFSVLWNTYVMGKLLMPAAGTDYTKTSTLGARVFPAEITAAQNMANNPATTSSPFNPGLAGTQQQQRQQQQRPAQQQQQGLAGAPSNDVGPVAERQAPPARQQPAAAPAAAAARPEYLGFMRAA
jgi:hypothetical protein